MDQSLSPQKHNQDLNQLICDFLKDPTDKLCIKNIRLKILNNFESDTIVFFQRDLISILLKPNQMELPFVTTILNFLNFSDASLFSYDQNTLNFANSPIFLDESYRQCIPFFLPIIGRSLHILDQNDFSQLQYFLNSTQYIFEYQLEMAVKSYQLNKDPASFYTIQNIFDFLSHFLNESIFQHQFLPKVMEICLQGDKIEPEVRMEAICYAFLVPGSSTKFSEYLDSIQEIFSYGINTNNESLLIYCFQNFQNLLPLICNYNDSIDKTISFMSQMIQLVVSMKNSNSELLFISFQIFVSLFKFLITHSNCPIDISYFISPFINNIILFRHDCTHFFLRFLRNNLRGGKIILSHNFLDYIILCLTVRTNTCIQACNLQDFDQVFSSIHELSCIIAQQTDFFTLHYCSLIQQCLILSFYVYKEYSKIKKNMKNSLEVNGINEQVEDKINNIAQQIELKKFTLLKDEIGSKLIQILNSFNQELYCKEVKQFVSNYYTSFTGSYLIIFIGGHNLFSPILDALYEQYINVSNRFIVQQRLVKLGQIFYHLTSYNAKCPVLSNKQLLEVCRKIIFNTLSFVISYPIFSASLSLISNILSFLIKHTFQSINIISEVQINELIGVAICNINFANFFISLSMIDRFHGFSTTTQNHIFSFIVICLPFFSLDEIKPFILRHYEKLPSKKLALFLQTKNQIQKNDKSNWIKEIMNRISADKYHSSSMAIDNYYPSLSYQFEKNAELDSYSDKEYEFKDLKMIESSLPLSVTPINLQNRLFFGIADHNKELTINGFRLYQILYEVYNSEKKNEDFVNVLTKVIISQIDKTINSRCQYFLLQSYLALLLGLNSTLSIDAVHNITKTFKKGPSLLTILSIALATVFTEIPITYFRPITDNFKSRNDVTDFLNYTSLILHRYSNSKFSSKIFAEIAFSIIKTVPYQIIEPICFMNFASNALDDNSLIERKLDFNHHVLQSGNFSFPELNFQSKIVCEIIQFCKILSQNIPFSKLLNLFSPNETYIKSLFFTELFGKIIPKMILKNWIDDKLKLIHSTLSFSLFHSISPIFRLYPHLSQSIPPEFITYLQSICEDKKTDSVISSDIIHASICIGDYSIVDSFFQKRDIHFNFLDNFTYCLLSPGVPKKWKQLLSYRLSQLFRIGSEKFLSDILLKKESDPNDNLYFTQPYFHSILQNNSSLNLLYLEKKKNFTLRQQYIDSDQTVEIIINERMLKAQIQSYLQRGDLISILYHTKVLNQRPNISTPSSLQEWKLLIDNDLINKESIPYSKLSPEIALTISIKLNQPIPTSCMIDTSYNSSDSESLQILKFTYSSIILKQHTKYSYISKLLKPYFLLSEDLKKLLKNVILEENPEEIAILNRDLNIFSFDLKMMDLLFSLIAFNTEKNVFSDPVESFLDPIENVLHVISSQIALIQTYKNSYISIFISILSILRNSKSNVAPIIIKCLAHIALQFIQQKVFDHRFLESLQFLYPISNSAPYAETQFAYTLINLVPQYVLSQDIALFDIIPNLIPLLQKMLLSNATYVYGPFISSIIKICKWKSSTICTSALKILKLFIEKEQFSREILQQSSLFIRNIFYPIYASRATYNELFQLYFHSYSQLPSNQIDTTIELKEVPTIEPDTSNLPLIEAFFPKFISSLLIKNNAIDIAPSPLEFPNSQQSKSLFFSVGFSIASSHPNSKFFQICHISPVFSKDLLLQSPFQSDCPNFFETSSLLKNINSKISLSFKGLGNIHEQDEDPKNENETTLLLKLSQSYGNYVNIQTRFSLLHLQEKDIRFEDKQKAADEFLESTIQDSHLFQYLDALSAYASPDHICNAIAYIARTKRKLHRLQLTDFHTVPLPAHFSQIPFHWNSYFIHLMSKEKISDAFLSYINPAFNIYAAQTRNLKKGLSAQDLQEANAFINLLKDCLNIDDIKLKSQSQNFPVYYNSINFYMEHVPIYNDKNENSHVIKVTISIEDCNAHFAKVEVRLNTGVLFTYFFKKAPGIILKATVLQSVMNNFFKQNKECNKRLQKIAVVHQYTKLLNGFWLSPLPPSSTPYYNSPNNTVGLKGCNLFFASDLAHWVMSFNSRYGALNILERLMLRKKDDIMVSCYWVDWNKAMPILTSFQKNGGSIVLRAIGVPLSKRTTKTTEEILEMDPDMTQEEFLKSFSTPEIARGPYTQGVRASARAVLNNRKKIKFYLLNFTEKYAADEALDSILPYKDFTWL